jgi:hypothetical protein
MNITAKMIEDAIKGWTTFKYPRGKKCNKHPNDTKYDIWDCISCRMEYALREALKGKPQS